MLLLGKHNFKSAELGPWVDFGSLYYLNRYHGQENFPSNLKIPSILYYRQDGTLHSAGAEAKAPGMDMVAVDENLILVEWSVLIHTECRTY